mmetsp:Transcript_10333/g.5311  ORF Transcript_10333/g.5311 Transcript_10333/m.5311 type:complete len:134 (-) Transcript_10333:240-641(-)
MWLYYVSIVFLFVFLCPLACSQELSRMVPYNYLLLFGFTLCESYVVAVFCTFFDPWIVLVAALMCLGVTFALTLYACLTTTDFTTCMGSMVVVLAAFIILGIFMFSVSSLSVAYKIYCFLGVLVYGIYLVIDT